MIRHSILSYARPIWLLTAVALAVPAPGVRAQDRAMQDRLDRLERDLSMLQRQVYRGGPAPVAGPGSGAAVDAELRMDRLEAQMRELTGRVEDAVNRAEQLSRRLEQINSDIDLRFGPNQGQPRGGVANSHAAAAVADSSPGAPVVMRTPPPGPNSVRSHPPGDLMPPGTLVLPPDPPSRAATLTPPGPMQPPLELGRVAAAGNLHPPAGSLLPTGSASDQYNAAFGLLKQADYLGAEQALKAFIGQHPNDPLAGSAQFWLGETYYARGRYAEAASAFAEGYRSYPRGAKAADDLLKLGMSLARADQTQNACVALTQLDRDFPHPGNAIKERAVAEKKRLGC
jgi:tol-pal system protein YbgF